MFTTIFYRREWDEYEVLYPGYPWLALRGFTLLFQLRYSKSISNRLINALNLCLFNSKQDLSPLPPQKSVFVAYVLWLFTGPIGGHHLYLHRDRQAFLWWCTLGGYFGIGWLSEVLQIPEMVRDANEDPEFIKCFVYKLTIYRKPEFTTSRFLSAIMIGYLWSQLVMIAIPGEVVLGIDWGFLHWLIPVGGALGKIYKSKPNKCRLILFTGNLFKGIWTVGNMGREKGCIGHCLMAAYIAYPIRYFVYDETYWMTIMLVISAIAFEMFSKEWRREPPKRHSSKKRIAYLSTAGIIYLSLWGSFFYFNGKITDQDGDAVPVSEAIRNFLGSPWWTDLKSTLNDTWQFAQHNGWYETWKQIVDSLDVDGEQNAFKVNMIE